MKILLYIRRDKVEVNKMKCYIYFIINKVNGKRYVGQTTNYSRRKQNHISDLKCRRHDNIKLQNAWDKYGEDNFKFEKITYENLTKEELNEEEIHFIEKYDSRNNGYNIAPGGSNGSSRDKLNFEQYCLAYFGNKKYDGMTNRTGKYLGVDSACIAAIRREESYKWFLDKALTLSDEEKEKYVKQFEEELDVISNPPWTKRKTLDKDLTYEMACVCSTYGRGTEAALINKFGLTKGFMYHLFTGNGRKDIIERYKNTSDEDIQKIGRQKFKEWNLQDYYDKYTLKEKYHNLLRHYKIAD